MKTEAFEKGDEGASHSAFSSVDEKGKRNKKYALLNEKVWTGGNKTKTPMKVKYSAEFYFGRNGCFKKYISEVGPERR